MRYRVDGVLTEVLSPKRMLAPLLVSRLKVMAKTGYCREAGATRWPDIGPDCGSRYRYSHVNDPSAYGERVVLALAG